MDLGLSARILPHCHHAQFAEGHTFRPACLTLTLMKADLSSILAAAQPGAAGSFNILNFEMACAIAAAASEVRSPVVIGVAARHFERIHARGLAPALLALAESQPAPVALHLDHALPDQLDMIRQALDLGFTSIMIDGSHLPPEKNLAVTRRVVALARSYGASVEGEMGGLAGEEGHAGSGLESVPVTPCTDPDAAERYARESGIDALAVAIGTAHGVYKAAPVIRFDVLEALRERVPVPLVLHGSTGVTSADIRACIDRGIRKINFFSGLLVASTDVARERAPEIGYDHLKLQEQMFKAWQNVVLDQIALYRNPSSAAR